MNLCIFGDSITHGMLDADKGGWATRLMCYCCEHWEEYEVNVYHLGIDGDTTTGLLKRLDGEAEARNPGTIVFAIGLNDASHDQSRRPILSESDFVRNLDILIERAKHFTNRIIFIGLTRVDEKKTKVFNGPNDRTFENERIALFDSLIQSAAERSGATYISCADVLTTEDLPDGLHPGAEGHGKLFEHVRDVLVKNILEKP